MKVRSNLITFLTWQVAGSDIRTGADILMHNDPTVILSMQDRKELIKEFLECEIDLIYEVIPHVRSSIDWVIDPTERAKRLWNLTWKL